MMTQSFSFGLLVETLSSERKPESYHGWRALFGLDIFQIYLLIMNLFHLLHCGDYLFIGFLQVRKFLFLGPVDCGAKR